MELFEGITFQALHQLADYFWLVEHLLGYLFLRGVIETELGHYI